MSNPKLLAPTPEELWIIKSKIIKKFIDSPATTGGRDRLHAHISEEYPGISRRDVERYLKEDSIQQQFKPLKKRVTTRPIVAKDRAKMAQIDLVDMQKLAGHNGGKRYFLSYLDLFSKYAQARALPNKTQATVTTALLDILDSMPTSWRPKTIQADNGSEFQKQMEKKLAERGIKLIHSQAYNPRTQGQIERLNKTIKSALFNLMERNNTKKWIDYLQPLIENINNSVHATTKYKPIDVMEAPYLLPDFIEEVHENMSKRQPKTLDPEQFNVGDLVRVALTSEAAIRKNKFRKRIAANWSPDVFEVYSVSQPQAEGAQPQYLLKNTRTNRKSRKLYWSYQMQRVTAVSDQQAPQNMPQSDEDEAEPVEVPQRPRQSKPSEPRRSGRQWAPSREGLRYFASRDEE